VLAAYNRAAHEACVFEDPNVLGDSGQGYRMSRGEFGHGRVTRPELMEDAPTDRMGNRRINGVELA
jgi:hypothetical protein